MAIFNKKPTITINALALKGNDLRNKEIAEAENADSLIRAAHDARGRSEVAGRHAEAVEKAVAILDEAGVTL